VKNDRTRSEVRDRNDAKSTRRPKKQDSIWPKDRAYNQSNRRARCVIPTDPVIRDNWWHIQRLVKKVEAISGEDKTTDDVEDVVLVSKQWGESNKEEPRHDCPQQNAAKISGVNIDQKQ
jgi:hypothetical protein